MKKHYLVFILLLAISGLLRAQGYLLTDQCFGGSNADGANSMQLTPDNGYIFAGFTNSTDGQVTGYHGDGTNPQMWVVKADVGGNVEWTKCLGGIGGDASGQIIVLREGGYLVVGSVDSSGGDVTQYFGGVDAWAVKLDNDGNIRWQKSIGGSGNDYALAVVQNAAGNYIIAGTTSSTDSGVTGNHGGFDAWVIELDTSGSLVQQHCYGGTGNEQFNNVAIGADGHYYFSGYTSSTDGDVQGNHGMSDIWVVKTDSGGSLLTQACFGGTGDDYGYTAMQLANKDFLFAGGTNSANTGQVTGKHLGEDAWAVETDTTLALIWETCIGGSGDEAFTGVVETGGEIVLGGYSFSIDGDFAGLNYGEADMFLSSLGSNGNLTGIYDYGGTSEDYASGLAVNSYGQVYICGYSFSGDVDITCNHGYEDGWVGKTAMYTGIKEQSISNLNLSVFPNPSTGNFHIQLTSDQTFGGRMELLNTLGEVVTTKAIQVNDGENNFVSPVSSSKLSAGIYLLRITDNSGNGLSRKVVIE